MKQIDEGENFRLLLHEEHTAVCQVWARPDVTAEEGARYAGVVMNAVRNLLGEEEIVGLVFDLRLAPGRVGPTTEAQLRDLITSWSAVGRRVAILVDSPELQAQMSRAAAEVAEGLAMCTSSDASAYAFVSGA